jgi:hypothetical protein
MNVVKVVEHFGDAIVTAHVDGDYDKTGLPRPLVLVQGATSLTRKPGLAADTRAATPARASHPRRATLRHFQ